MGTDIHGGLYTKLSDGVPWCRVVEIEDKRNYTLFSILAGVRNYHNITPISEPRGLPDWIKPIRDWKFGDHSFSWLTLDEISEWDGWTPDLRDRCGIFLAWLEYAKLKSWGSEGAIVFGFDS